MLASRFTIKLIGFDEHETECFQAIFALAESRLDHQWQIARTEDADFYLFLAEPEQKGMSDIPVSRCLFYATENLSPRHILVNEGRLPSLRSVVEVLNRAAELALEKGDPQENTGLAVVETIGLAQQPETAAQTQQTESAHQPDAIAFEELLPEPAQGQIGQAAPVFAIDSPPNTFMAFAQDDIAMQASQAPVSASDKPSHGDLVFYPDQGLLQALLAAKTTLTWMVINDEVDLWLDPEQGHYYSWADLAEFAPLCSPSVPLAIQTITAEDLQKSIEKHQLAAYPLNNLIWYVTFKASQGRLLAGHSSQDVVRLSGWPNLRLPEGRNFIKLAAFMHSNAVPLLDIAKITNTPLAHVFDFYNACYLVGLVEKGRTLQIHDKPVDLERQGLLQKIRDRLKL